MGGPAIIDDSDFNGSILRLINDQTRESIPVQDHSYDSGRMGWSFP